MPLTTTLTDTWTLQDVPRIGGRDDSGDENGALVSLRWRKRNEDGTFAYYTRSWFSQESINHEDVYHLMTRVDRDIRSAPVVDFDTLIHSYRSPATILCSDPMTRGEADMLAVKMALRATITSPDWDGVQGN